MLAIYKRELRSYFSTPLGYIFCGMFLLVSGLIFYFTTLANQSTESLGEYFIYMIFMFAILIPLLTMKLFAEDRRTKTEQLLLTAPVSLTGMVMGKYLAALTIYGCTFVVNSFNFVLLYLYGTPNTAAIIAVLYASFAGLPVPFAAVHLLFINLVTDCFPALALGMEEAEPSIMRRRPRDAKAGIFAGGMGFDVVYQGVIVSVLTIAAYFIGHFIESGMWEIPLGGISPDGTTMAFITMSMAEIAHSLNMRSQRGSIFKLRTKNKVMTWAALGSLVATTLVCEVPFLANAFGFSSVSFLEYGISLVLALLMIPIVEIVKFFQRRAAEK
mgnify:CR=1 FL=1